MTAYPMAEDKKPSFSVPGSSQTKADLFEYYKRKNQDNIMIDQQKISSQNQDKSG